MLSAGIEPASPPSEGDILSIELRELRTPASQSNVCPRQESNLDHKLRKLAFYPLNYEGSLDVLSQTEHLCDMLTQVGLLLLLVRVLLYICPQVA